MKFRLSILALLAAVTIGCASAPIVKAQHASVDLHAILATVQDAETALCNKGADAQCHSAVPAWTTAKHAEFNGHLVVALKAGKAFNEAVRTAPVGPAEKLNFASASNEVAALADLIKGVLPPDSPTAKTIDTAKDAILALLPLFLS